MTNKKPLQIYKTLLGFAQHAIISWNYSNAQIMLEAYGRVRRENERKLQQEIDDYAQSDRGTIGFLWDDRNLSVEQNTLLQRKVKSIQYPLIGLLEQKLIEMPQIQAGKNLWQNAFHEFDVFDHTLNYVEHLKNMTTDAELIIAGYLHDIGKPVVAKLKYKNGQLLEKEGGKPYHEFDNHEIVGEEMVRKMPSELFEEYVLNQGKIAKLVGAHFLPMEYIKKMRTTTNYPEFLAGYHQLEKSLDLTGLSRKDVMTMFLADCLAKGKGCTDIKELKLARKTIIAKGNPGMLKKLYDVQKKAYGSKE